MGRRGVGYAVRGRVVAGSRGGARGHPGDEPAPVGGGQHVPGRGRPRRARAADGRAAHGRRPRPQGPVGEDRVPDRRRGGLRQRAVGQGQRPLRPGPLPEDLHDRLPGGRAALRRRASPAARPGRRRLPGRAGLQRPRPGDPPGRDRDRRQRRRRELRRHPDALPPIVRRRLHQLAAAQGGRCRRAAADHQRPAPRDRSRAVAAPAAAARSSAARSGARAAAA